MDLLWRPPSRAAKSLPLSCRDGGLHTFLSRCARGSSAFRRKDLWQRARYEASLRRMANGG